MMGALLSIYWDRLESLKISSIKLNLDLNLKESNIYKLTKMDANQDLLNLSIHDIALDDSVTQNMMYLK